MLLENLTYPQVEEYLEDNDTILVPVGSVEQHSEYGLLGTDFITAEAVAREVGKKQGVLVAPTINYGVSPHHLAFAGTVSIAPTTFIRVVEEIIDSLVRHGFSRIYLINGHGGNRNAIACALQQAKMHDLPGQFAQFAWYEGLKETEVVEELFQGEDGSHATPSEISLTMLLRPQAFEDWSVRKKEAGRPEHYWPLTAAEMRAVFPDGRMGASSWLATVDRGRLIYDVAVDTLADKVAELRRIPLL